MKKRVLMSLVLLALIGTSAVFAQRVGETVQVTGQTYRVESNTGGRLGLQLVPSLDGVWRHRNSGLIFISFSGNTAVFSDLARDISSISPVWQDAKNKGIIKVGDQYLRNLRSAGSLKWSGQYLEVTWNNSNRNVAIGTRWIDGTFAMDPSGDTFTDGSGATWIRAGIQ